MFAFFVFKIYPLSDLYDIHPKNQYLVMILTTFSSYGRIHLQIPLPSFISILET